MTKLSKKKNYKRRRNNKNRSKRGGSNFYPGYQFSWQKPQQPALEVGFKDQVVSNLDLWKLYQVGIQQDYLDNYNRGLNFPMDCCPCVFKVMNIINEQMFIELQQKFGNRGYSFEAMEDTFNYNAPQSNNFKFIQINPSNRNANDNDIIKIYQDINVNNGTIGGILRSDGTAHCIVFARNLNNQLVLIDPQNNKIYFDNDLLAYLNQNSVISVYQLRYLEPNSVYELSHFMGNMNLN